MSKTITKAAHIILCSYLYRDIGICNADTVEGCIIFVAYFPYMDCLVMEAKCII